MKKPLSHGDRQAQHLKVAPGGAPPLSAATPGSNITNARQSAKRNGCMGSCSRRGCCRPLQGWCQSLLALLVGDLPASLSLRTRLRIVLETRLLGTIWTAFQVIVTLVACAFYVIRTYDAAMKTYDRCEVVFAIVVALDLVIRWYADDSRRTFFFKASSLIDVASLLPLVVDGFCTLLKQGKIDMGLVFLRFVKILKLVRVLRAFRLKKQLTSAAAQQMLVVALVAASLIFVSASLINMSEDLPFGTSVYFTIVTMATVGYGDIGVTSAAGRFVVCCVIIASFVWLPMEINKLTQMLSLRSRFLTTFVPQVEKPNVLVVGHIEASKLRMFLTEFLHPDRRSTVDQAALYQVVILNPDDPSDDVLEVLEDPLLEGRVTYIKGTLMNEDDLNRAGAHTALACFILARWVTADTEAEDAQTVLRTLMIKTYRPSMPCYVQLHHSHNRVQLHMLKKQRVTCIEELKMPILALSALYPGFTTLLSNLITSTSDLGVEESKLSAWEREYTSGSGKELYSIKLHDAFTGVSFKKAAMDVFTQFEGKVLLMGIEEREVKDSDNGEAGRPAYYLRRALLNPGSDYVFKIQPDVQVWAYILAKNRRAAERILTLENTKERLTRMASKELDRWKLLRKRVPEGQDNYYCHDVVLDDSRRGDVGFDMDMDMDNDDDDGDDEQQQHKQREGQDQPATLLDRARQGDVTEGVVSQDNVSTQATVLVSSSGDHMKQPAMERGTSNSSSNCMYKDMDILLVDDVDEFKDVKDHIVLIAASLGNDLDFFLQPLRVPFLGGTGYSKHVVILTEGGVRDLLHGPATTTTITTTAGPRATPVKSIDSLLQCSQASGDRHHSALPCKSIYVVEGNPHKASDLKRTGLDRASACVVLADMASVQEIDEMVVDEFVIHQFLTIEKMRSRLVSADQQQRQQQTLAQKQQQQQPQLSPRPPHMNYVVEVLSVATLKILDQTYKTCRGKKARGEGASRRSVFRRSMHYLASNANRVSSSLHGHKRGSTSTGSTGSVDLFGPPGTPSKKHPLEVVVPPRPTELQPAQTTGPQHHRSITASKSTESSSQLAPLPPSPSSSFSSSSSSGNCFPFVTSGSSFLIDLFDVMSCQLFFNSDMLRFVDLLLLQHSPSPRHYSHSPSDVFLGSTVDDGACSGRLASIPVPLLAVGQTFGTLFEFLMNEFTALPISLYRHDAAADVFYVYTGPTPDTVLRMSDSVFFVAPLDNMARIMRENPPRSGR